MIRQDVRNVKRYCSEPLENIENYDKAIADTEHVWDCHHRNEICLANQSRLDKGLTTRKQLIADGMYYHRPACELIFLRHDEHTTLHNLHSSEESKRRKSNAHKGKPSGMKGKNHSEETRRKVSESLRRYWMSQRIKTSSTVGLS